MTIPAFTVYVYGSSDANLNDAVVEGQQVASYYVSDSQDLTGTADDYTRTLSLPASAINADLLEEVAPGGDRFLVGQVVFDGDPTGELSVPFRFQGGTFETTDTRAIVSPGSTAARRSIRTGRKPPASPTT